MTLKRNYTKTGTLLYCTQKMLEGGIKKRPMGTILVQQDTASFHIVCTRVVGHSMPRLERVPNPKPELYRMGSG